MEVRRVRRDFLSRLPDDRATVQRLEDAELLDKRPGSLIPKRCPLCFDPVEHGRPRLRLLRKG